MLASLFAFMLGAIFGSFTLFAAQLLSKDLTRAVERYQKTGSIAKSKPIIIDPTVDEEREREVQDILNNQL